MKNIDFDHNSKRNVQPICCGQVVFKTFDKSVLCPMLFSSFNRYQEVKQCWRKENNVWCLKNVVFTENWEPEQIEFLTECLHNTLRTGGVVWGALFDKALIGFSSLENEFFGIRNRYLQLSSLHVSYEKRGLGIGKRMFQLACEEARKRGAEKLYISAHSSKESQAFYRSMKCTEAKEYNMKLAESEPCDCQLELDLTD